jgi:MFS family permease
MLIAFNAVYAIASRPAGALSDRLGRKYIIAVGWLVYTLVYLGFALSSSEWLIWPLFALYGLNHGIAEGVCRAFVADLVIPEKRGTAYGLYHSSIGFSLLAASLLAGWLWDNVSPATPFYLGAGLSAVALAALIMFIRKPVQHI